MCLFLYKHVHCTSCYRNVCTYTQSMQTPRRACVLQHCCAAVSIQHASIMHSTLGVVNLRLPDDPAQRFPGNTEAPRNTHLSNPLFYDPSSISIPLCPCEYALPALKKKFPGVQILAFLGKKVGITYMFSLYVCIHVCVQDEGLYQCRNGPVCCA